jgi:hypothetical protein
MRNDQQLKLDRQHFTGEKPLNGKRCISVVMPTNGFPIVKGSPISQRENKLGLNGVDRIEKIWEEILITAEPPEEPALMSIKGTPTATTGNHELVIGKKKSRKTLFIVWYVAQYIGDLEKDVLCFDTEQGKRHVWKIKEKFKKVTDKDVPVFYLRGKSPKERRDIIASTIEHWPTRPKIIVIDGIRDLLSNINDPDQCTELMTWLEALTVKHNLHIINVLHQNKTDNNPRGHIGSELLNKAETTIELEKDFKTEVTIVRCESSRNKPFESFAFTHSDDGLPVEVNLPMKGKIVPDSERRSRLIFLFGDESLKYAQLLEKVREHFELGAVKAKSLIAEFCRSGWIVKNGKDHDPNVEYKLMINESK